MSALRTVALGSTRDEAASFRVPDRLLDPGGTFPGSPNVALAARMGGPSPVSSVLDAAPARCPETEVEFRRRSRPSSYPSRFSGSGGSGNGSTSPPVKRLVSQRSKRASPSACRA